MIKIEKHDIKKLEEYIQHINNYRRELKMREYELLESHEPDNAGAGKSNLPGNPIERCAIKKFSDNRYNTLRNIVNGVDRLIDESDEDTLELLRFRYWDCPIGCYEWEDIAHYFGTSKTSILRRRNALIDKLAKYIGYV
ncbi:TPA: transcriptional regulator [Staphylococcus aureus]|uniref:transcriptional regulator n=1 Tax=Staphylococcus aureus TaxID=1280 RepID=UPI0007691FC8|nr:transcriptional regulator [Staphylococcus aureus]CXH82215.1 Phage transcriptional activator [Staphylococcus aureus]CXI28200.1 Phage transcriptional activator [Staphylococcus aureus]HCU8798648.1 transcriptional regulator [Staphylococcus aureus]HDA3712807.1 transcriptional regulator [Staphylococcus aureus]HDH1789624.1 transcriptional regulator [Staphylococcus aureus]